MGTVVVDITKIKSLQQALPWAGPFEHKSRRPCCSMVDPDSEHCVVVGAHAVALRMSSFFGLAPLRFKPNGNGYVVSLSIPMCIYSYLLVTALVSMAFFCITSELQIGDTPFLNNSSHLLQVMEFFEVFFLAIVGGAGVYGAPARMRSMIKFMDTITAVDKTIGPCYSRAMERRICVGFFFVIIVLTLMMVGDIFDAIVKAPSQSQGDIVLHYLGSYLISYFITILEVQFAVTVMMVYARFRSLNKVLSLTAKNLSKPNMTIEPYLLISPTDVVYRITLVYSKLGDVVRHLENSYSSCLVIILIDTMFALIFTPYFAFCEIYDNVRVSDNMYQTIILQSMWFSLHLFSLLIVVEPCHYTTAECDKTQRLVNRMMLDSPMKGALTFQLQLLSRQLMMQPVSYKPLGTVTLGRPLVVTILGTVTTYLVILIQFQKYEI